MYNDENNLYHYTYRKDGSEPQHPPVDDQLAQYRSSLNGQPVLEEKPKKKHTAVKLVALALVCALLGGAMGAGITTAIGVRNSENTSLSENAAPENGGASGKNPASQVTLNTSNKTLLTDQDVYARNVDSVVSINVKGTSGYNYFGQPVESASAGSGFVLTKDGYIVTNYHVIEGANTVKVTLYNGDTYDAEVIGGDEDYDIAVIKVNAGKDLQPVTLGSSDDLRVGDRVLAIGNPLGELTFSMTGGMVSSVNRTINVDGTPFNMIQTDASINPGNSGGPLVSACGEVVGIVSAKYSSYSSEAVEGLGFAIPINDVLSMIQDIMTNGYVSDKAYLGAFVGTFTAQMKEQYRYDIDSGAFIYSVEDGAAAAKAGLKMGDVITKIDKTKITSLEDFTAAKKKFSAGDQCTLEVYREGKTVSIPLTWDQQPKEDPSARQEPPQNQRPNNGYPSDDMEDLFNWFFGNRYGW